MLHPHRDHEGRPAATSTCSWLPFGRAPLVLILQNAIGTVKATMQLTVNKMAVADGADAQPATKGHALRRDVAFDMSNTRHSGMHAQVVLQCHLASHLTVMMVCEVVDKDLSLTTLVLSESVSLRT